MDIAFNACIKELESNTPKCDFNWGVDSAPPPWQPGNERPVGNRVKLVKYHLSHIWKKVRITEPQENENLGKTGINGSSQCRDNT